MLNSFPKRKGMAHLFASAQAVIYRPQVRGRIYDCRSPALGVLHAMCGTGASAKSVTALKQGQDPARLTVGFILCCLVCSRSAFLAEDFLSFLTVHQGIGIQALCFFRNCAVSFLSVLFPNAVLYD